VYLAIALVSGFVAVIPMAFIAARDRVRSDLAAVLQEEDLKTGVKDAIVGEK